MSIRHKKLPIAALERIDDLCAAFEQKWQSDEPPAIESVLAAEAGDEREVLLAELVVLDIDYRRRRGDKPTKQEYLDRFPEHASVINDALSDEDKPAGAFAPPTVGQLSALFPALEIVELLGAGGMGAVYKARQKGLDRVVALKILPEEFAHDVKFALRFTREARTLAKLNHPSIVSVFEFGKAEDTYYFLMEFVDGTTLRDVVAARQLPPEHALTIVPHLCDALQYAHDNGVIHRDIKPENILMAKDGSVKIADFGLSRILGNEEQPTVLTRTHQIMGTPRYMAPEQLEGGARSVDHRADIYSLGVVFYEMLTGELPIGRFAVPSQKVKIDVRLDEVVLRTLEKEPQRRYQHASQIKSDVQSIASTDNPALAPTMVLDKSGQLAQHASAIPSTASLQQQELAGRLLLTRRELMDRVRASLRPLFRGQVIQILIGVLIIAVGAQCWAQNTHTPHRLISGLLVHIYGILVIVGAGNVLASINRIDYSEPVDQVRSKLDQVKRAYLRFGSIIGFPWWLMWLPFTVAAGFDAVVTQPNSLYPSLVVGVIGMALSYWLYLRVQRVGKGAEQWRTRFAGGSVAKAYLALQEIEHAQIQ